MNLISSLWRLPLPCSLSSLWISVGFWPNSGPLTLFSTSQLLPNIFYPLIALGHSLENSISHSIQLTHSLFRRSDLLVSMSIEVLLSRIVFYISKSCIWFFFRSSRSYYSFLCLAYVFSLCFIFLHRKTSYFVLCSIISAT